MHTPDEEGYLRFIEDSNRREIANSENYDKSLLTLSTALLALAVTFSGEIVPFDGARSLWLLLLSWALFTLTIIGVIGSFIYGQHVFKILKANAKNYYLEGDLSKNALSESFSNKIRNTNTATGVLFILGIVAFTIYVGINISGDLQCLENAMN